MPTICSPLSGEFIELAENQHTHLNNIQLSDCNVNNSDSQIDVLIGADHYWDFMKTLYKAWKRGSRCYQNRLRVGFTWDISIAKL